MDSLEARRSAPRWRTSSRLRATTGSGTFRPRDDARDEGAIAMTQQPTLDIREGYKEKFGFHDDIKPVFKSRRGLDADVVAQISEMKGEPAWMREFRLKSYQEFLKKPLPMWGGNVAEIDFQNIFYYLKPMEEQGKTWEDVPSDIKRTFDKLGIPEAEQKFLSGVGAQYDSEVVYHKIKESLEKQGVIFLSCDHALRDHEALFKEYFGTVIPSTDNKFAPTNSSDSLHSAVVEIIVKKGARCRYTTIQNWSNNVYNLVTKRAVAYRDATMEWVDGNLGSKLTMKYPAVILKEPGAHGEVLSIAFAGKGQHQDAGAKITHAAPNTTSTIISKSISKDGGRAGYRGLVKVVKGAHGCRSTVNCDALLLDEQSRSDTYPYMEIEEERVSVGHEATVSKIGDEQLFYLQSRGINKEEAAAMIVSGFIEPIVKELPMEYAVEMNRLIQLQMEGSVG